MSSSSVELTRAFEAGEIEPGAFRHLDHVVVAFEMLRKYDFIDASLLYGRGIRALAERAGAPGKFNMTITMAFLSLIAERMGNRDHATCKAFLVANKDLLSMDALTSRYSSERLRSDLAREIFLMPDIAA
ncbi:MAG: hypothetical protein AAF414_13710 [Pseudomonadota bacterium]